DRQLQQQAARLQHDALAGTSAERPAAVLRQFQRQLQLALRTLDHLPGQDETDAVDRVAAEVAWQLVRLSGEGEAAVADAAAPRHHRIRTPGDGRIRAVLAVAHELLDPVDPDLGDA